MYGIKKSLGEDAYDPFWAHMKHSSIQLVISQPLVMINTGRDQNFAYQYCCLLFALT